MLCVPRPGWPLFGFSPLHLCQGGWWVGGLSEGMPVWAKNVENVQERWRLDHCGQAGGATLVFAAYGGRGSFRWVRRDSECPPAPPPQFIFGCTLWVTLSILASPDELWKTAIGGSGSDVLAEDSAIKDCRGCCSDFALSDPHCIQALGRYDKQDMGRTCFVRPNRSSEYCELCLLFRLTKFSYSQPNTWLPLLSGVEEMLTCCLQQQSRPFELPFPAFTETHAFWFDLACLNMPVKNNYAFLVIFPPFKMAQVKPNLQFNLDIANIWVAFLLSTRNHSSLVST